MATLITVGTTVNAPIEKVWNMWAEPQHIIQWNSASDDWHTTRASNDLKEGGTFNSRMEAKDGSFGFDFSGVYDKVINHELIEYTIDDGRKVKVIFSSNANQTAVTEIFEAETNNSEELQKNGWQAIIDNFKKYTETN